MKGMESEAYKEAIRVIRINHDPGYADSLYTDIANHLNEIKGS